MYRNIAKTQNLILWRTEEAPGVAGLVPGEAGLNPNGTTPYPGEA
nr:MAG: hypothetical protein [Microvirus sp.]